MFSNLPSNHHQEFERRYSFTDFLGELKVVFGLLPPFSNSQIIRKNTRATFFNFQKKTSCNCHYLPLHITRICINMKQTTENTSYSKLFVPSSIFSERYRWVYFNTI